MITRLFFITIASILLLFGSKIEAQEIYGTSNGSISLTGVRNDSTLTAVSNNLVVLLNYETAEFEMRLDKSTLHTGVKSIDEKLEQLNRDVLIYKGKLGLEFIETHNHPPQDFVVGGYFTWNPNNESIFGKGHLEHIHGVVYSCILNIILDVNLKDIDIVGLDDKVRIEIMQTVLKRENY